MKPSQPDDNNFLQHLADIGSEDAAGLTAAQRQYGNSWKTRGGIGAFMMLARKWDRLEIRAGKQPVMEIDGGPAGVNDFDGDRFDIFQHAMADERAEGIIDDIRDLRRYLMLVEAELRAMDVPAAFTKHRDNS